MIVGVHNFVDAVGHYNDEVTSSEGGLWLVMMDGLLLLCDGGVACAHRGACPML